MNKLKFLLVILLAIAVGAAGHYGYEKLQEQLHQSEMVKKMQPDLAGIYQASAQAEAFDRNPVIVIPGLLGSRLIDQDSGRVTWGAFTGESVDPANPSDARILTLPMMQGTNITELQDQVAAAGVLDRLEINLHGLATERRAYLNILRMLGVGGYRDEELGSSGAIDYGNRHFTCFQFPYDWRHDNVLSAKHLHDFVIEKSEYIRRERLKRTGVDQPVKFDIVAHSMGGLIARYFLRYGGQSLPADGSLPELNWAGTEHVERVVMIGTPNAGSVKSLKTLLEGVHPAPLLPTYEPAHLGTMPALYQLLPRPRHAAVMLKDQGTALNLYDINVWEQFGWGMLSEDQDALLSALLPKIADKTQRRTIARDHVQKCLARAQSFHAALDQPATPPAGVELHLFAGDAFPTPAKMLINPQSGKIDEIFTQPGDSTVPRTSALLDERLPTDRPINPRLVSPMRLTSVRFLFADHFGMTEDPAFTDNVLYLLLVEPRDLR